MTLTEHAAATKDMVPHIATLYRLALGAQAVIEFGVRTGVSTWAMLDAIAIDGHIWSYDVAPPEVPARVADDPRWHLHLMSSVDALTPPARPDVVFIDSSHEYHQTRAELALVRRWGARTIVLHDWNLPDVHDAAMGFCERSEYRVVGIEPSLWGMAWLSPS